MFDFNGILSYFRGNKTAAPTLPRAAPIPYPALGVAPRAGMKDTEPAMDYSKFYNSCVSAYSKIPRLFGDGAAFRPLTLFVELTYRCNFRCNMCQFLPLLDDPRLNERKSRELSTEEVNALVDQISPFGLVCFTGGEPLLRGDIAQLVRHAAQKRKFYLVTNGILLDRTLADLFVSLGCSSLLSRGAASIGVSLEAIGPAHDEIVKVPGSYEKIVANVKYLVQKKREAGKKYPLVWLKCVVTNHNVRMLDDMYALAEEIGVDMFNPISYYDMPLADRLTMTDRLDTDMAVPPAKGFDVPELRAQLVKLRRRAEVSPVQLRITPPGLPPDDIVAIYEGRLDLSNKTCHNPWSSVAVSAYGDVFPCGNYSAGNIRQGPFLEIWNNEKMRRFRRELKEKRIFKACAGCCSMVSEGPPSVYAPPK